MSDVTRFRRSRPCPICGGGDDMPRGQGLRCSGFLSSDGRFAYCTREENAGEAQLEQTDPPSFRHILEGECRCGVTHAPARDEIEATYDYVDERRALLFQVVRKPGKRFLQRRQVAGEWVWKLGDTRRVLYRLNEVALAAVMGEPIYVVEGEKDVHAVEKAGAVATCNPGGAGKWRPEYASVLEGGEVTIVADRDEPGIAHARQIAASLNGTTKVRIVRAAVGKDVSDHLAAGKTLDELEPLPDDEPARPTSVIYPQAVDSDEAQSTRGRIVDGWTFVQAADQDIPALWGDGEEILWAAGEPLMLVGPDGVGKTSLGQQLVHERLTGGKLLGLTVAKAAGRVLYVAADRPSQAARSMRRMITEADEDTLRERLIVHRGPLPFDLLKEPAWTFSNWVQAELGASEVVVDSLKDLAPRLNEDEVGSAVSRAFQETTANGVELLVLHHQRKQQSGVPQPKRIAEVYGSRWLTACMGSVVLLWGEPGDLVVAVRHLKQPLEEVGPFNVLHDHVHGRTTVHDHTNLEQLLARASDGLTCRDGARLLFAKDEPQPNEIEKARRRLESLVGRNRAERRDDPDGLARYFAKEGA